jgi:hypothetical protein
MEKLEDFDMEKANARITTLEGQVKELWELLQQQQIETARLKQRIAKLEEGSA